MMDEGIRAPAGAREVEGLPSDTVVALIKKNGFEAFDVRIRSFVEGRRVLVCLMKWNMSFYSARARNGSNRCGLALPPKLLRPMIEALEKAEAMAIAESLIER